jgi:hypothetical protein
MWSRMAGEGTCYTFHITVNKSTIIMASATRPMYGWGFSWSTTPSCGWVTFKVDISRWRWRWLGPSVFRVPTNTTLLPSHSIIGCCHAVHAPLSSSCSRVLIVGIMRGRGIATLLLRMRIIVVTIISCRGSHHFSITIATSIWNIGGVAHTPASI